MKTRVRVHERGDRRLDGILKLIEDAGRARPLPEVLRTLCESVASIAGADVVSIYVAEGEELVMRANVGLAAGAVGNVRLRIGEGLTGFVAECLRPVSLAVARLDERYVHVPGIGEDRVPSYLGIPLLSPQGAAGVLVLQRREAKAFPPAEVALATALAAPVAFALERARSREEERTAERGTLPTARTARLPGVAGAPGLALGRADVLPALDGLTMPTRPRPGHDVALAFGSLARELSRARERVERTLAGDHRRRLRALALVLGDDRFRALLVEACGAQGLAAGLRDVVREYARAPFRVPSEDDWLSERASEVEALCVLIGARASGRTAPEPGAIIVAESLSAMLALGAIARRSVGVALAEAVDPDGLPAALLRTAGVPLVSEVTGLYAWARPGDRMLLDGDAGLVRVNPPPTAVARFRAKR
jgi:phosphotransferase system, enzyme I, PtsP